MNIEFDNNKRFLTLIAGIISFLTIIHYLQNILGLPGILHMHNYFNSESQFKLQTTRIDPSKKINNDKNFQLKKHQLDSIKAVWGKMKADAAKRKIIPIQEETDSAQNENQDELEEINITNQ